MANVSRMTNTTGSEDKSSQHARSKSSAKSSASLAATVCYNVQIGGYGAAQRRELALEWLREQEDEDDKIKRWTLYAAVTAAAISIITLLVTLGVMK